MDNDIRIKNAMDILVKAFETDNLPRIARAVFRGGSVPSDKWSIINRILMIMEGTEDARGYRQWQEIGRYVKPGSHAFYILVPRFIHKIKETVKETVINGVTVQEPITENIKILAGFLSAAVFRYEDTDGTSLNPDMKPGIPYAFNGILGELGLKVDVARFTGETLGRYSPVRKEIKLMSPDIDVFLHELAHAVDHHLRGDIKPGQNNDQEVTAEMSAAVIGYLMGYEVKLGNVKDYISRYNMKELVKCITRIEDIVNWVIERTAIKETMETVPAEGVPAGAVTMLGAVA